MKTALSILSAAAFLCLAPQSAQAEGVTRSEAVAIARSYAELRWTPTERNVLRGPDRARIPVRTPNRPSDGGDADERLWVPGTESIGMPYKWGGFDSLQSFAAGIRAGKAAGDLYNAEKRRRGGAAVSSEAVGIDCSGFVSRCWKLPRKYGTATLTQVATRLSSPSAMRPGDVMNTANGHVVLLAEWKDGAKSRALFYEAEPFSKVLAQEYEIASLVERGFQPLRYRKIRED